MSDDYEYAKRNMLQSLENARVFVSYMQESDCEMSWELDEMIAAFKRRVKQKLNKYEKRRQI